MRRCNCFDGDRIGHDCKSGDALFGRELEHPPKIELLRKLKLRKTLIESAATDHWRIKVLQDALADVIDYLRKNPT